MQTIVILHYVSYISSYPSSSLPVQPFALIPTVFLLELYQARQLCFPSPLSFYPSAEVPPCFRSTFYRVPRLSFLSPVPLSGSSVVHLGEILAA